MKDINEGSVLDPLLIIAKLMVMFHNYFMLIKNEKKSKCFPNDFIVSQKVYFDCTIL